MRIALVKLSSLGDVVHALPVAAALRAHYPRAHLTWVVERRESALLKGNPALDDVAVADTRGWRRRRGPRAMAESARALRGLLRRFRDTGFDVALDLQGNLKSGVLTAATGAAVRVGFSADHCREPLNALFTNRRVRPPASARHVVDQHLSMLPVVGVTDARPRFWLPDDPEAGQAIDDFVAKQGVGRGEPIVVLNPGAGREAKRWPPTRFAQVARRLRAETPARVFVLWGPAERHHAEVIAEGSGAVLAPPTDLAGLLALLRRARVMVAADTGPLHLAAALGVSCVGLYGPTDPDRNGPYGRGHRVVRGPDGTMTSVSVEAVLGAARALLAGEAPSPVSIG